MEFYRGKSTKNEPRSFWIFTFIVVGIVAITLIGLFWFWNSGHEIIEPKHDNHPQTSIIKFHKDLV